MNQASSIAYGVCGDPDVDGGVNIIPNFVIL